MSRRIYFDIDGVLADFDAAGMKLTVRSDLNAASELLTPEQRQAKKDLWLKIEKTEGFWENLAEISGARELLAAAAKVGELFVLSKAPGAKNFAGGENYTDFVVAEKKRWASMHFGEFFQPENILVIAGGKKEDLVRPTLGDILIDDRPENIAGWIAAGGRGILFTCAADAIVKLSDYAAER
jgi:FMN phosphatase YigB (HAD superfamily)